MDMVHYLGYISDRHGVHVDPTKIQVIHDWPSPTTLTELQRFLGLANFYHRFMLGLSHIAWALSQVTRGGGKEKILLGVSQQQAFNDLNLGWIHMYAMLINVVAQVMEPIHDEGAFFQVGL